MTTASAVHSNAFPAIFWGGVACGVGDISQAFVVFGLFGARPIRILQTIASGLLGPAAFQGGMETAALGAVLHFVIAFGAAAVYWFASRQLTLMTTYAVLSGLLYGEAVFLFMHFVVVPLSRAPHGPFGLGTLITGPIGHMFLVGLPIALIVRHFR
jgi:uncharacterized membrane protein YagU involved in acid resistance